MEKGSGSVSPGTKPGYRRETRPGNVLTMDGPPLDPGMGATNLKGLMCNIHKA